MKEAFEKIKERLEEERDNASLERASWKNQQGVLHNRADARNGAFIDALSIVSEVEAEYINKSTESINKSGDCSTNWIPCSERLPEKCGAYLVSYKNTNCIPCATVFDGVQFLDKHVIAWMPLPEPYKPEKGAQDGGDNEGNNKD